MDKQTIGIAASINAAIVALFLCPPDLASQLFFGLIAAAVTTVSGLAIRKLESPDNPLPQALYSRIAACATLGFVATVVLVNALGLTTTSLE